ncbi:hypothetical protein AVDCRST_MAG82-3394 [uncultured Rubrobacteraceae bacterium]|uniref:Uncharacterized protein n=1 Tax=uncultured Rubrobacteraceae bacterium TaxID=349277 RepID=A0A6J4QL05_9ACTN|nr:hypothetical protein AVDCRST_MAG82-3394 [uncultured Rubrobacteraceae bacterium]
MKISVLMRWVGPAAIAGGVFMVLSDLSGLPITIPYLSTASPTGFDAVGSGLILVALTLLLVGMVGLYARGPAPNAARVIEYGEAYQEDVPRFEQPAPEEEPHEAAGEQAGTLAPRASRVGALVLGTGLVVFLLMRH